MGTVEIVGALVVVVVIAVIVWQVVSTKSKKSDMVDIIPGSISGKQVKSVSVSLDRSFNQPQGATFSYTGWILVNDFTHNYGKKRTIFTKDDCPGLYLDTTSNSLLVAVNTYADIAETVLIDNIPADKWVHFAIIVDQDAMDVYINGIIRQHHSFSQLPKQNDASVTAGGRAEAGWDGVLATLQYTPRSLSAGEVAALTANVPKDDLRGKPSGPQYFDLTWYTGRT
jgi:Concanavalin A-like lectin/glucanases superfamily